MTVRLRILALLSLLSFFCIGTTFYFKRLHVNEEVFAREQRVKYMSARLERLVGAVTRSGSRCLQDYAGRREMLEFISGRELDWAEKYLKEMAETGHFDLLWVLKRDGTVVCGWDRAVGVKRSTAPVEAEGLRAALQESAPFSFFVLLENKLLQMQGRPIMAGTDEKGPAVPAGWLVLAKHWDNYALQDLGDAAQGRVTLTGPSHSSDAKDEELEIWLPLMDHRGAPVAGLDFHAIDPLVENSAMEDVEYALFLYNGIGAVLLVAGLMHFWISRPFSLIRGSLVARNPALLAPLLNQRNEFGQVARILHASASDREQLQRGMEDRIRLGRELHDGVIQSVYGTGMALSRVQSLMGKDPVAAQQLLDETKAELNRIILELRRYVDKADPKPLDSTFETAVAQLIQQSAGSDSVASDLSIDEELIAGYPRLQRNQALQFVREAVSNAVRHGHPTQLTVSWQRVAEGSKLIIADNGVGFDSKSVKSEGRGLGNLSERAVSLGGRLEIDSSPNQGTRICLTLPKPVSTP